jgi:hypothetical protein
MEELYLVYVHRIGFDHTNQYFYEFIFSESIDNIDGEDWDSIPAKGNPQPPYGELIAQVGKIATDFKLDVIQDSDSFSMYDAVDGVIALAWENIDNLEEYPEHRIAFSFGMEIKEVADLLYQKDVVMDYKFELENE